MTTSPIQSLSIICQDGYSLAGKFYPASNAIQPYPILIAAATGITQQFYQHFALWLSQQGYNVLSFDFRGIGQSLHEPLTRSTASIMDWGQLDLPAAVDTLLNKTGAEQVILIGHSAGGQLLGIMPNYHKVAKLIAVAGSTGHVKGLKGRTKYLAPLMFKVIFPIACKIKGYAPTKALGMGENLPKRVALEWAKFCAQPGYVINAFAPASSADFHQHIKCPILCICASDDEIATAANVQDLMRLYPHAKTQYIKLMPQDFQHTQIGHMLMFKPSHQNIWPTIAAQFVL